MKYKIQDLVDVNQLQLLTETLYNAQGLPSAIITVDGEVLGGAGWKKICTEFHRNHPQTKKDCIKSDCRLNEKIAEGEKYVIYECPRGLVDSASPIFIEGEHVANVFTGQFFTSEPTIETEQFFREQANQFGFDEEEYIEAFREIPIFSNDKHRLMLNVLVQFAELISSLASTRIRELDRMKDVLDSQNKISQILHTTMDGFLIADINGRILEINDTASKILGFPVEEIKHFNILDIVSQNKEEILRYISQITQNGTKNFETKLNRRDGTNVEVEVNISWLSSQKKYFVFFRDITDKKNTRKKLRLSELRFRKIVEGVPEIAIQGYDEERRVTFWNQASENLYGYSAKETLGKKLENLIIPDEMREQVICLHKRWLDYGEKIPAGELNLKHKNGHLVPVFSTHILNETSNGKEMFCMDIDLKPIRDAENELQKSELRASALLEAIPDMMFRLDNNGVYIDYHAEKSELHSQHVDSLVGKSMWELIPTEFADLVYQKMQETLETNNIISFKYEMENGKKELKNYEARMVKSGDEEVIAIVRDITEDKQSEIKLKESEERYQRLADAAFEAIFFSHDGVCINQNKTAEKMFGFTLEEAIGRLGTDWIHPDHREQVKQNMISGIEEAYEAVALRKDGTTFDCEIQGRNTTYSGREIRITALRDISDRKNAERAIIESQRLGALGEMSSAVAHDFNNILQSIFGNLELSLTDKNISDKTRKHLETIMTSASDAAARIQLLQRFGGNKKFINEYKLIQLNDIINDVIIQLRPLWKDYVEKHGIQISITPQFGDVPKIKGDQAELRSVLYNIIKNSIEAMPAGGDIFIQTRTHNEKVKLAIIDTGVGMDKDTSERVFQPFFSTKGYESGRGLGMSGAYSIIKEHKGEIIIQDTSLGYGTTVEITLPVPEYCFEDVKVEMQTSNNGSANILWVDDEEAIRDVVAEQLVSLGHTADIVSSGLEALENLRLHHYDLVITDIGMPGMSGWQLAEKINEEFSGKIKVAVLSGWGAQIEDETIEKYNVNYVLGKPYKITQLNKMINQLIGL